MEPRIIIFDEPTTMLDPEGKQEVRDIIEELNKNGYTIILITNDIDEIAMSKRKIALKNGEICHGKYN